MVTGQALPVDQRGNDLLVDLECITAALALRVNFADHLGPAVQHRQGLLGWLRR